MVRNSIYQPLFERREDRRHLGYKYKGKILKNSLSNQMFNVNETLNTYIAQIDKIVYEWVEAVKQIKIHANPAVGKYDDKIK